MEIIDNDVIDRAIAKLDLEMEAMMATGLLTDDGEIIE